MARLASALRADAPASKELRAVEAEVRRGLRSYESHIDTEAVAQEAVIRVFERMRAAPSEEIDYPGRFLRVVAKRLALDQMRTAWVQRTESMPTEALEIPSDDDAIATLLVRETTAQLVTDALSAAAQRDDHSVVRCVAVWLDLAERRGEPPTTRDVAARTAMSHAGVGKALLRFREYLEHAARASAEFPKSSSEPS